MKLLISTMLHLIHWDGEPHYVHSGDLSQGSAHYNGITWDDDTLYVSGAYDFEYCIYQLDPATFAERGRVFGDLHETHQIFYQGGLLYVTNTGKNRVEVWDKTTSSWSWIAWNPSTCDIDHINGIWSDGHRFYISEFRHKVAPPSIVRVCDNELALIEDVQMGDPIHNIYIEDNVYHSLVSRTPPGILCRKGNATTRYPLHQLDGMLLRGLARSADNWFVGASRWETERDKRHVGDALVVILDNDFQEVDRIEIKDAGPVCGVRLIDTPDLAHNGMVYPDV